MTEDEKKANTAKIAEASAKRVKAHLAEKPASEKGKSVKGRLSAIIEHADKEIKLEAQQKKEAEKKLSKEAKNVLKAKKKVEEAKKALEEARKKNKDIKKAEDKLKKAQKDLEKAKKAKMEKEKLGLKDIAKRTKQTVEKLDKVGVKKKEPKDKDKDKNKEKEKSNDKSKSEQKVQLASRINVNGMDIQQHGPKFVLVGKNGRETDVTDVMNEIDKYNKGVDAKNAAAKAQGAVQKGVEAKANEMDSKGQGLPTNGANGNVVVKGTPELVSSVPPAQQKGAEDIVAAKLPALNPEEKAAVAKTAMELSKADLLKDPKGLEKLNDRKKKNDEKEQQKMLALRAKQSTVTK